MTMVGKKDGFMGTAERKKREKEQRRQEILKAAKEVFFSKGLEAATMDEIARRAQLSKGTLYLYFKSKEELYVSLMDEGIDLFMAYLENVRSVKSSATKQIQELLSAFYSFYADDRQYYEIIFSIQNGGITREKFSDEVYEKIHNIALNLLNYIKDVVKKGILSGEFINVDAWEMALSFWALATGIFSISGFMEFHDLGKVKDKRLLNFSSKMLLSRLQKDQTSLNMI
jgi:AcrR family transcriptional regulator